MTDNYKKSHQRISVGGIRFSQELVQVSVAFPNGSASSFAELLRFVAQKRINIPFVSHSTTSGIDRSTFCVNRDDFEDIQSILGFSSFHCPDTRITRGVGTLTIFPHNNSFLLLGRIIGLLGRFHFPIYSLCTSISAIAINTDYIHLNHIVEKLRGCLQLPQNHAPFRQEFYLKQLP